MYMFMCVFNVNEGLCTCIILYVHVYYVHACEEIHVHVYECIYMYFFFVILQEFFHQW